MVRKRALAPEKISFGPPPEKRRARRISARRARRISARRARRISARRISAGPPVFSGEGALILLAIISSQKNMGALKNHR